MLNNGDAEKPIRDVLSARLSAGNLLDAQVDFVDDFDGEPVVRITANLKEPLGESDILFQAADEIRDRLLTQGDKRFVFVQQSSPGLSVEEQADEESIESDLR